MLPYRFVLVKNFFKVFSNFFDGAGDGNRTHATSLEGWDSTIELHPHGRRILSRQLRHNSIIPAVLSIPFADFPG